MKQLFTLLVAVVLAFPTAVWATTGVSAAAARFADQGTRVAGVVQDAEGNPIQGATVRAVSTTTNQTITGTYTDASGRFSFTLNSSENVSIVVSYVNFKTATFQPGENITVVLEEDILGLEETVIVGNYSQRRGDVTGSVAVLSSDKIQNVPATSFEGAVQGRVAGVQISAVSGLPGSGQTFRIRGTNSLTASAQPLIVIDGVIATQGNFATSGGGQGTNALADLNPQDIESYVFLKDAAATAQYGARGANGVVVITTKRGKVGKTKFSAGWYGGIQEVWRTPGFTNSREWYDIYGEAWDVAGNSTFIGSLNVNNPANAGLAGFTFSWPEAITDVFGIAEYDTTGNAPRMFDEVLRSGYLQEFNIAAEGGNEKTTFRVGLTYRDEEGYVIENKFKRLAGSVALDHQATDKIKIGATVNLIRTINNRVSSNNNVSGVLSSSVLWPAILPYRDSDGNYIAFNNFNIAANIPQDVELNNLDTETLRLIGNVYANYRPIDGLEFETRLATDIFNQYEVSFQDPATIDGNPGGSAYSAQSVVYNWTSDNKVSYTRSFAQKHVIGALFLASFQRVRSDFVNANSINFATNGVRTVDGGANVVGASANGTSFTFTNYLLQLNYSFDDKYQFQVLGSYNGSSRFSEDNQYGFFPAVSVGWVLSKESFLQGIDFIGNLKLRASVGLTGNAEIGNFPNQALTGVGAYNLEGTLQRAQLANPDLTWEETLKYDVGVEFSVWNDRISGTIDYYRNEGRDNLLSVPVPSTTGFTTQIQNIGEIVNSGLEITLAIRPLSRESDLQWTIETNHTYLKSEVTNLFPSTTEGQNPILFGAAPTATTIGQPVSSFYLIRYLGVNSQTGTAMFEDLNGDGQITALDRQFIGSAVPDWIGGLNNTLEYKGVTLSVFLQYSYGNEIYDATGASFQGSSGSSAGYWNLYSSATRRWQNPGDQTDVPRPIANRSFDNQASTRYLYDGSFLRLKTVELGYQLPKKILEPIGLTNCYVYALGQNLYTWTGFDESWDPEVNNNGTANVSQGINLWVPPIPRSYVVGVRFGF